MEKPNPLTSVPKLEDAHAVSPALERYTTGPLLGDLWKRAQLSPRDGSMVMPSVLVARNQTVELPYHLNPGFDNGVKPAEISEIITHLAFYSGWANATSAVGITKAVFDKRGVASAQLPPATCCRSTKPPKRNVRTVCSKTSGAACIT
jgi:4-carboxymuconolactone decarboxylase